MDLIGSEGELGKKHSTSTKNKRGELGPLQLAMHYQVYLAAIPCTFETVLLTSYKAQFTLIMATEIHIWVQMEETGKSNAGQAGFF